MPHYILVTFEDDKFVGSPQAHEHVVHALHGHARAIGRQVAHRDVFPVWEHGGQRLDPQKMALHTVQPGEVVHLVAPPGHVLVFHQYHANGGQEHHTEATVQSEEDFIKEHGYPAFPRMMRPQEVPDEVTSQWPQHETVIPIKP